MALNTKDSPPSSDGQFYDPESGRDEKGRKMSRLGTLTDDPEKKDVDKQIELEAGNAIKYRTCSWQKVN